MIEQVDIETCRTLHQLHYFGDMRTLIIGGETLVADDKNRVENDFVPHTNAPRLHDVSSWLRRKEKIDIRIECRPRSDTKLTEYSLWKYQINYNKGKSCVIGKRCYNDYGGALEDAIIQALSIIEEQDR